MPWPILLGPPPRMSTLRPVVGADSQGPSYVEYMYGVSACNNAATNSGSSSRVHRGQAAAGSW
jgi:hypothetical protein